MRLLFLFTIVALTFTGCSTAKKDTVPEPVGESNHPFLIVKKEQFDDLRAKASVEPWKSMKADAIARANIAVVTSGSSTSKAYNLQYHVGAAALAYILDEDNAQKHAHTVRDDILNQYPKIDFRDGGNWGGVVPPMGSAFAAILALDIVYDALTQEEIRQCEEVISSQIFKIDRDGSWADVRLGTHGTWDIYKGDRTTPDDEYYEGIMAQVTPDGVSPVTIHYAWERVGGGNSRLSKSGYMDVLEFTGIDRRYYDNERLRKFQRWLFGSSVNTSKEMCIIGDMLPTQGISNDMLHRRVVNFDLEAAAYAAWFHEGRPAIGHILTYIVPKEALPAPQTPQSQFYTDGGAFLREKPDDPDGLHAVLYNIKGQDEWHTHQETNGLALSGYGNRLMVNGGRLGAPTRAANLNNTLTIDGADHRLRIGNGLVEGFATDLLDYACGDAGPAIGDDHYRNLLLVHAADGANAYIVLFDEVDADPGEQVKTYLHPANQSSVSELSANVEYNARIDHQPTVPGAELAFFYATPPQSVNVEKVPSAVPDRYPDYPDHSRLEAVYDTDGEGRKNIVTILFPHDGSHAKATFAPLPGDGFSGGSITQAGNVVDYAFESNGQATVQQDGASFQAKAILYRKTGDTVIFYFARHGMHWSIGQLGFDADQPVSIYYRDGAGALVVGKKTLLTLKGPGVGNLQFTPAATILSSGDDRLEVELSPGDYVMR